MEGITPETAVEAMRLASHKLPLRTKFITDGQADGEGRLEGRIKQQLQAVAFR